MDFTGAQTRYVLKGRGVLRELRSETMDAGGAIERLPEAHPARAAEDRDIDQALLLVQEGMLKMLRFQLALVRQDRRVAMQTIDGVISLERELAEYIQSSATARPRRAASQAAIAEDRAALVREKFTLAAGHGREAGYGAEAVREREAMNCEALRREESPTEVDPADRATDLEIPRPAHGTASWVPKLLCGVAVLVLILVVAAWTGALPDWGQLEAWAASGTFEEERR